MKTSVFKFLMFALCLLFTINVWANSYRRHQENRTFIVENENIITIENNYLSLTFEKEKGVYQIYDKTLKKVILKDVHIAADGWNYDLKRSPFQEPTYSFYICNPKDSCLGKSLILSVVSSVRQLPEYKFEFFLPNNEKFIVFRIGIKNTLSHNCRFMKAKPFTFAKLFPRSTVKDIQTLNGAAGKTNAEVLSNMSRVSENSMLLTCKVENIRYSIVWGGLKYQDFYAVSSYDHDRKTIDLEMTDPVGKLIRSGEEWWTTDSYYLGMDESNPFTALEKYGDLLSEINHAHPHIYDFPTLCGWGVGHLSKGKDINNSVDLIDEAEAANKCGLTKYTKVAIRLEPDFYCYRDGNTEQGWWDDEHWSKFGHLRKPYDTFAKWCKVMYSKNALPFTYFQSNLPSNDFAETHPDWMLNEDITKLHLYHQHNLPYVRYDYTDKEFQNHLRNVWRHLKTAGVQGIKFDYPETAWNLYGGFDDKFATSTFAYRTLFQLAREGLGDSARLTERNLGVNGSPCLDVTAGIIDLQRVTKDNNKFDPQHISTVGLRWYKSRKVFNYYTDSKHLLPLTSNERKSLITMTALTSGMLELSTSFNLFTPDLVHDVSRMYPVYDGRISPRPIDAFTGVNFPQIYDLQLTEDWHQLAVFNSEQQTKDIKVQLGTTIIEGGMQLDSNKRYYIYDFWNNKLIGIFKGNEYFNVHLGSLESAIFSVKEVGNNPQIIHTNRHIMQGWMDTKNILWEKSNKTLHGASLTAVDEPYIMIIALNGMKKIKDIKCKDNVIKILTYSVDKKYVTVQINSNKNAWVHWSIKFQE